MEALLEHMHIAYYTFGANLHAQLVLINKVYALELSRKFIKSALLVGYQWSLVHYSRALLYYYCTEFAE